MFSGTEPTSFFHVLGTLFFPAFLRGLVLGAAAQRAGQAIHVGYPAFFVLGLARAFGVAQIFHQGRGRCIFSWRVQHSIATARPG
jgi:hypothetical protein